jgi:hypothetical protein
LIEKLMDKMDNVIAYLNDLLMHSSMDKEDLSLLDLVLTRIQKTM